MAYQQGGYEYGGDGGRYGSNAAQYGESADYPGGMDKRLPPADAYGRYDDAPSEARYDRPRRLVAVEYSCSLSCIAQVDGLRITI